MAENLFFKPLIGRPLELIDTGQMTNDEIDFINNINNGNYTLVLVLPYNIDLKKSNLLPIVNLLTKRVKLNKIAYHTTGDIITSIFIAQPIDFKTKEKIKKDFLKNKHLLL
jgi:hypothetical protein